MGVYHLMGLGRSPGAITGPISFLAKRYVRFDATDQLFFSTSGEGEQRRQGQRVGNIQAVVLFTTPEILDGSLPCFDFVINPAGTIPRAPNRITGGPMRRILPELIRQEWAVMEQQHIVECKDHLGKTIPSPSLTVYWCAVNRRDIRQAFERVAQVVVALREKELWANLTGGTNVLNFALELTATLSGEISRLYYGQAHDETAEKCVRYTAEEGYWVELPALPLNLSREIRAVIDILTQFGEPVAERDLRGLLYSDPEFSQLVLNISPDQLHTDYLRPMWKQGLIGGDEAGYSLGPRWLSSLRPYDSLLLAARQANYSMNDLIASGIAAVEEVKL